MAKVQRAFRYRFCPTPDQAADLSRTFGGVRRSAFRWQDGQLTLARMTEPLDIRWSRPLPEGAEPSTVTVSRDRSGRWHVSILCQDTVTPLPATGASVGIDAGITSLVTFSTGEKVTNPKHERRDRRRLAKAQRSLSRKQPGSANRDKARVKVARGHARIADRRKDHLHKLTTRIVRDSQAVVIEDLSVRNVVRNHCLAPAISDAAWQEMRAGAGLADRRNACGGLVRPEPRTRERHGPVKQETRPAREGIPVL